MNYSKNSCLRIIPTLLALSVLHCSADSKENDDNPPHDTETAAKETDSTRDTQDDRVCIGSISGKVTIEGDTQEPVQVIPCIGVCFPSATTDDDGNFKWQPTEESDDECIPYDFTLFPLHVEIRSKNRPEAFAEYSFVLHPTQEMVSDEGEDDYDLNLGTLSLYALSPAQCSTKTCSSYTPEDGAAIDRHGLVFDIPKDGLVKNDDGKDLPIDHDQYIKVFEAPLDEWTLPFTDVSLDALYFIGPRWAKLAGEGAVLSIEPLEGWENGDTGTVYLLGGYISEWGDESEFDKPSYIYVDKDGRCTNTDEDDELTPVEDGVLTACGEVEMKDDRIVTPPIPRLTWVGIGR